jgi:hypothetical protein
MTHSALAARALLAAAFLPALSGAAAAHGFAGDRFFPATILTDDPFVADELSLPTFTRNPTGPDRAQQYDLDIDVAKRLTRDIGVSIGHTWSYLQPKGMPAVTGSGGLDAELDWQFFRDGPHEATAILGLHASFGHTGRVQALGAPDVTTLSPVLDVGKGFGDLPETLPWLRPFAVTGNLSLDFPTKAASAGTPNQHVFNYGFAVEYSLEYLQHHVRDIGLRAPFDRMVPVVEMAFGTGLDRGQGGQTTGTIQPGLIWAGQYVQIGAEAILPVNAASGRGFGGVVQVHFYLDDLFPRSLGRPVFGD